MGDRLFGWALEGNKNAGVGERGGSLGRNTYRSF